MSKENNPEALFDIDKILLQFTNALTTASNSLHVAYAKDSDKKDLPYVYHIPKMSVSINLELIYSKNKVKGVFRKTKMTKSSAVESNMTLEVVSVPRTVKP
jgi:hypothetical protein